MLYKFPLIICLMFMAYTGKCQAFDIQQYVDQLPPVAVNANEAWQQFYPKGKRTTYQQYEAVLDAQINALTDRSNHQSLLLSMLSGRYEEGEAKRIDFTKIVIAEDPELKKKQVEQNRVFFNVVDDYGRLTAGIDSILKLEEGYGVQAEKMLRVYQQAVPVFVKRLKLFIKEMNDLMNKKGYNAILDNQVQTHKYYIQLLEVRGLLLDRIRHANRMIGGSVGYVAALQAEVKK